MKRPPYYVTDPRTAILTEYLKMLSQGGIAMKENNSLFVKGICMMIAVIVPFLLGTTDRADAGNVLIPVAEFTTNGEVETDAGTFFKSTIGNHQCSLSRLTTSFLTFLLSG